MSKEEIEMVIDLAEQERAKCRTKEYAERYLQRAGILDGNGELAEGYEHIGWALDVRTKQFEKY